MTRAELEKRARVITRLNATEAKLSTSALMLLCEVAESLRVGEVRVEQERRAREEMTNVH